VSVTVIHAIPGRMRLRIPSLKGNAERLRPVGEHLSRIPLVARVDVNPVTGSVLVVHRGEEADTAELVQSIAERLAPVVGVDEQSLHAHLSHQARPRPSRPLLHRDGVHGFFRDLNASFKSATGGPDLNLLVPALLVLLGFRGLLRDDRLQPPRWYDFMWFGFATYLMLNNPAIARELKPATEDGLEDPGTSWR
jgi:hypothetical protein